ncbi:hypothetical protein CAAN1_05S00540 [[Candida] anglica]|uniref:Uncharacterized protein n=1 Tax=[Candida] anglica TaxID=148631 RepID=A0ABP0ECJ1_9ASCO
MAATSFRPTFAQSVNTFSREGPFSEPIELIKRYESTILSRQNGNNCNYETLEQKGKCSLEFHKGHAVNKGVIVFFFHLRRQMIVGSQFVYLSLNAYFEYC